jgi:cytochrome P450
MAQNPEIQRRGQQEVDQHLSSGDLPRVVDALDMPYVVALAKETMRWRPALPLSETYLTIFRYLF